MITVLNPLLQPLAVIDLYDNDSIDETINGEYKFSFTTLIDPDGKSEYLTDSNLAEIEDQLFNIVHHRRTRAGDGSTLVAVECEQVSYDLVKYEWADGFVHAGTPLQLLTMVLEGTGFTVGTVELSGFISVNLAEENISARAILMEIAVQSSGELRFDRYSISLLVRRGALRPVRFQLGKNLKGIVKDVDIRSGDRVTAYEIDVLELNSLPEFYGLEYFELGDTVGIGDPELGIDEQQRIVGYSYSPRRRINSKVTISKKIPGITDAVVSLRKTTVVKDKVYNGTRIGPENGFEAIRSDNMARTVMNATEGIKIQKGNGSGSSWTDVIYLDTEGNAVFSGKVTASIIQGSEILGGTIMIGSGDNAFRASDWGIWLGDEAFADADFSVTPAGKMKAVDADFQGRITATDIEGGVITGTKYQTSDTLWPRVVIDPSSVAFGVYADEHNGILIPAYEDGISKIRFLANGDESTIYNSPTAGLVISGFTATRLAGPTVHLSPAGNVYIPAWSRLYSDNEGMTLQDVIDNIYSVLNGKANVSHSHTVTIPPGSAGGTFSVS
ncbi:hypothetical protein H70357_10690 [Paenibacillus sp. FSL H7-0357]|uniref:prophage endopeptidase tail family protein n=1 Tax=Paenibacillus sp. FSL H7-0357 TaxID=1536774 RepID=UPI0004F611FC|nr:prophage endopeptidase tail family protein [Paenibacillus sp. FSL H7-0357]AIQ17075.1 hypothetical protein H70357_10690 [Paenibacillus sp. FSL H7-0357]